MPELSRFYGIVVLMYFADHAPPHFHAKYAGKEVQINIRNLAVIEGGLAPRALGLLMEWAQEHQQELLDAWERAARREHPGKIAPLR